MCCHNRPPLTGSQIHATHAGTSISAEVPNSWPWRSSSCLFLLPLFPLGLSSPFLPRSTSTSPVLTRVFSTEQLNSYKSRSFPQRHPTPDTQVLQRQGQGRDFYTGSEIQQKGTWKNQDVKAYLNSLQCNSPQGCRAPHPNASRQIPTTISGAFMGPVQEVIRSETPPFRSQLSWLSSQKPYAGRKKLGQT